MTITAAERRPDPAPHLARAATGWIVDTSTFGARLALVRNHMKWNVKEAARECGQAAATWRVWEMEGAQPRDRVSVSKMIATRTGCDFLWLVHGPDRGDGNLPHGSRNLPNGSPEPTPQPVRVPVVPHVVATVRDPRPVPARAVRVHPKRRHDLVGV